MVVVAMLLQSASARGDGSAQPPGAPPVLLVWGDSLSAGYGLQRGEAWPDILQTRLQAQGFPHDIINGSISGETSAGGRARLPEAIARHKPALLILELGANDGLRGLPPRMMRDNLNAMIRDALDAGAQVLLVGMQMPPNYGPAYTRAFAMAYREVAEQTGVSFVPFLLEGFAADPTAFLPDGIHPTAEMQPRIIDNLWPALKPLLEATRINAR